jgi:predicted house-cleaning noncanonical NTP pyrophosphatase (MazG superfamily)
VTEKLIRDRIPQIAASRGDIMTIRVATLTEMPDLLTAKLREEVAEYLTPVEGDERELVDILEVLFALARCHGRTPEWLEEQRAVKFRERGGFTAGLVWAGESDG